MVLVTIYTHMCSQLVNVGVPIYGCAKYQIRKPQNIVINRKAVNLAFKRKHESISTIRRKLLINYLSELPLYEISKTATRIIRSEDSVACLENLISEDETPKTTKRRTRSRKLCLLENKCYNFSIRPETEQMLNKLRHLKTVISYSDIFLTRFK